MTSYQRMLTPSVKRMLSRLADAAMALIPQRLVGEFLSEAGARLAGSVGQIAGDDHAVAAEQRVRGGLVGKRLRTTNLRLGRRVVFEGRSRMEFGDDVTLYDGVQLSATGERGYLKIGAHTHVDRNTVLYAQGGIEIGEGCAIAAGVTIYSQTNRFDLDPGRPILQQGTRYAPVKIGNDVWIGAGAIVLPGALVGNHAVIAAGAVVRGKVDEWHIVAGVPAKTVRDRRTVAR